MGPRPWQVWRVLLGAVLGMVPVHATWGGLVPPSHPSEASFPSPRGDAQHPVLAWDSDKRDACCTCVFSSSGVQARSILIAMWFPCHVCYRTHRFILTFTQMTMDGNFKFSFFCPYVCSLETHRHSNYRQIIMLGRRR